MVYLRTGATSHVAFVHYDAPPSHIYTIMDTLQKLRDAESWGLIKIYRYPDIPQNYLLYDEPLHQKTKRFIHKKFSLIAHLCKKIKIILKNPPTGGFFNYGLLKFNSKVHTEPKSIDPFPVAC